MDAPGRTKGSCCTRRQGESHHTDRPHPRPFHSRNQIDRRRGRACSSPRTSVRETHGRRCVDLARPRHQRRLRHASSRDAPADSLRPASCCRSPSSFFTTGCVGSTMRRPPRRPLHQKKRGRVLVRRPATRADKEEARVLLLLGRVDGRSC